MLIREKFLEKPLKKSKGAFSMIDVLDHNGVMTGETLERSEVHKLGRWHRAVHLYLIDSKNNLLMQKRSEKVDHYPNQLSISVTGHVDAGEFSQQAMEREIHEGGGVEPSKLNLKFMFSIKSEFAISADYIDRQFNDVYIGKVDELKLEEVHFNI